MSVTMPIRSTRLFNRLRDRFVTKTSPEACFCLRLKRCDSILSNSRSRSPRISTLSNFLSTLNGLEKLGARVSFSRISFLELLIVGRNSDL